MLKNLAYTLIFAVYICALSTPVNAQPIEPENIFCENFALPPGDTVYFQLPENVGFVLRECHLKGTYSGVNIDVFEDDMLRATLTLGSGVSKSNWFSLFGVPFNKGSNVGVFAHVLGAPIYAMLIGSFY